MTGSFIVGFTPVGSGPTAKGGTGLGTPPSEPAAAPAAADSFESMVGETRKADTKDAAVTRPDTGRRSSERPADKTPPAPVATGLSEAPPLDVAFSAPTPVAAPEAGELSAEVAALLEALPDALEPEAEALLADLDTALKALEEALAAGEALAPETLAGLGDVLAAIARLLGIELQPAPPGTAVATAAGANPVPPVAAAGNAAAPPAAAPALPATASPTAVAASSELPAAAGPGANAAPGGPFNALLHKLTALAEAAEPLSPALARRLEALVQALTPQPAPAVATTPAAAVAQHASTGMAATLQSLLAPATTKPDPAAPAAELAPPRLDVPAAITRPSRPAGAASTAAAAPTSRAEPGAPVAEAKPVAGGEPRLALDVRAATDPRPAADPAVRASFAEVMKAADTAAAEPLPAAPTATTAIAAAATAGAKAIHAAYQAPIQQLNIPQIAFEVVRQVQAGNSRFQIRLDPPELGRIDVRLDVDQSGNVNARMTVERAETLDLMQRDQRALERALAQAGLDASKTNLEFSLRQNPSGREDSGHGNAPFGGQGEIAEAADSAADITPHSVYRGSASAGGVNLFV